MQPSLAAELLNTFTPGEGREFRAFLARPERRVRQEVRLLAEQLLQGKTSAIKNRQRANQIASWLYAQARAFLLEKHWSATDEIPLVRELNRRGLTRHRDRLLRHLEKQPLGDRLLELELARYNTVYRGSRSPNLNLQQVNELLDVRFVRDKLRQACLMVSHATVASVTYDMGLLPAVLAYLDQRPPTEDYHTAIYQSAYRFLSNPEATADFLRFQQLLPVLPPDVTAEERRDLYLLGINFCIRQANRGIVNMVGVALDLYRAGLKDGSLLEDRCITPSTYRNVLALSLKAQDYVWADTFTEEYVAYLPRDQRDNLYRYNRARLAHAQGKPDQALEELRFVRPDNVLFTLTLDTLRAKVYYETEAYDLLVDHLDKMAVFLRRKDSSYHHRNYSNFIAMLRKILHLRPRPNDRQQLRNTIAQEPILTERSWLLRTLDE